MTHQRQTAEERKRYEQAMREADEIDPSDLEAASEMLDAMTQRSKDTKNLYVIMGEYQKNTEEVDTADSLREAGELLIEYRLAFGPDWRLWVAE